MIYALQIRKEFVLKFFLNTMDSNVNDKNILQSRFQTLELTGWLWYSRKLLENKGWCIRFYVYYLLFDRYTNTSSRPVHTKVYIGPSFDHGKDRRLSQPKLCTWWGLRKQPNVAAHFSAPSHKSPIVQGQEHYIHSLMQPKWQYRHVSCISERKLQPHLPVTRLWDFRKIEISRSWKSENRYRTFIFYFEYSISCDFLKKTSERFFIYSDFSL